MRLVSKREETEIVDILTKLMSANEKLQKVVDTALAENVRLKGDLIASFKATTVIAQSFRHYQDDPDIGVEPEDLDDVIREFRDRLAQLQEHNLV